MKYFAAYNNRICPEGFTDLRNLSFPFLDIEIVSIEAEPDTLVSLIKRQIDLQHPVLLEGNLRSLFYSYHYLETDWPHLFLIKGYHDEKKLFYIIDGCQGKAEEHVYEEFAMEYDTAVRVFASFVEKYGSKLFFAVRKTSDDLREEDVLGVVLDIMLSNLSEQPYREKDEIQSCLLQADQLDQHKLAEVNANLIRLANSKKVLFTELFKLLESNLSEADRQLPEQLVLSWKLAINRFFIACYKKHAVSIDELLKKPLAYEMEILGRLAEIAGSRTQRPAAEAADNRQLFSFENNEDGLIESTADNRLVFHFGHKLYNSWIADECPKAILVHSSRLAVEDFTFRVSMKAIFERKAETSFHGGIIVKTLSGELYFWGLNCGQSLLLSKIGHSNLYLEPQEEAEEIGLQLRKEGEQFSFGYYALPGDHVHEVYRMVLDVPLLFVAIGCKTWDEPRKLEVVFEDVEIRLP
jgi:hypothetical protein